MDSFRSFCTSAGVTTPWLITKFGKLFATTLGLYRKTTLQTLNSKVFTTCPSLFSFVIRKWCTV